MYTNRFWQAVFAIADIASLSNALIKHIDKTSFMVILSAMSISSPNARALAALGHDARLAIFRLLVKAGKEGLRVGDIAQHLDFAPSTLAHHLSTLVDAGLVLQEKRGREVFSMTNYAKMHGLLDFLAEECCAGVKTKTDELAN